MVALFDAIQCAVDVLDGSDSTEPKQSAEQIEAQDHQNKINKENIEKQKREQELIKRNRDKHKLDESQ